MNQVKTSLAVTLLAGCAAFAQQSPAPAQGTTTVRGCLDRSRGNYVLVEEQSNLPYVLKGVGSKLDKLVHHQVEVKGRILPGSIKTGIRSEKAGSNPSDTVHNVDGTPLQVANVQTDVRTIANRCKAADQQ